RHLGLPNACLALEQERLSERDGEIDGRGQRAVGEIGLLSQRLADGLDRTERSHSRHGRSPADPEAAQSRCPYSLRTSHGSGNQRRIGGFVKTRWIATVPLLAATVLASLAAPASAATPWNVLPTPNPGGQTV